MDEPTAQSSTEHVRVTLSAEDAVRVHRLSEEVQGRLEELALIATRSAGMSLDRDAVRQFVPRQQAEGLTVPTLPDIEVLTLPGGTTCCLIFRPDGGVTFECPCGAAGPL
jgi:hypothetical protein